MTRQTTETASPAELAGAAAEGIRALAGRTVAGAGYGYASDVDATLAEVSTLLHALPQVLTQAGAWLRDAERHGLLGHDAGARVGNTVGWAVAYLDGVTECLHDASRLLEQIRSETHHLTGGRP